MRLLQKDFQKVVADIPLDGLLVHLGFAINKSLSKPQQYIAMVHPKTSELILVFKHKGDMQYLNPAQPSNSGGVLDVLLNYKSLESKAGETKGFWEELAQIAESFKGLSLKPVKQATELEEVTSPPQYFLQGLQTPKKESFSELVITEQTLNSSAFDRRVFSKGKELCFPLQNRRGQVVGNLLHYNAKSRFQDYGDSKFGMWLSNTFTHQKSLIVVDHPLEALAHYQLFPNSDVLYAAVPGKLHHEHISFLQKMAQERGLKKILFGFSNTTEGFLRDYLALGQLVGQQLPILIGQDLDREQLIVKIAPKPDQQQITKYLFEAIKRFNTKAKKEYDRLFSLEHAPTLAKSIVRMVPEYGGNGYRIHIPLQAQALKYGLWLFHKAFGLSDGKPIVAFVKSTTPTWYEDATLAQENKQKTIKENRRKTAS